MNIDPKQIAMDVELMNSSLRDGSNNKGNPVKVPKIQNNTSSDDHSDCDHDDGDDVISTNNIGSSDGSTSGSSGKKTDSSVFRSKAAKQRKPRKPRPKGRTMTNAEYSRRHYEKHKEDINQKNRERYRETYIHKKEGWTKPDDDEERIRRVKEAKKRYGRMRYQREKALRAKPEDELTESERIELEKIRERRRETERRRYNKK